MGLQALVNEGHPNPRTNKVNAMLTDMTSEQVELFRTVIRNRVDYSAGQIAAALQADGFNINAGQINHYRRKLDEGTASI